MNKYVFAFTPWQAIAAVYRKHDKSTIFKIYPVFWGVWKYQITGREHHGTQKAQMAAQGRPAVYDQVRELAD